MRTLEDLIKLYDILSLHPLHLLQVPYHLLLGIGQHPQRHLHIQLFMHPVEDVNPALLPDGLIAVVGVPLSQFLMHDLHPLHISIYFMS